MRGIQSAAMEALLPVTAILLPSLAYAAAPGGSSSFVAPAGFPTSIYSAYWTPPVATQEPQPKIYDPVLKLTFPKNLTDPNTIPEIDVDPIYYPVPIAGNVSNADAEAFLASAVAQIQEIVTGDSIVGNCSKCVAALNVGKVVAQVIPSYMPDAMVALCEVTGFASKSSCEENYAADSFGPIWTQVLALADISGSDGVYICADLSSNFCKQPTAAPLDTSSLFSKPKPKNAKAPKASGKRVKVLHLSDFHLDPRYSAGAEANCTAGLCCRTNVENAMFTNSSQGIVEPAPLYGAFKCDTPYFLATAALESIGPLTGTSEKDPFAWTVYTGDLVAHDTQNQLSRAYTEYHEVAVYGLFKKYITGPVFAVLGNHDSNPEAIDAPHSLPGPLGQQQSWNYNHVAALWQDEGWIGSASVNQAKAHYAAYSTVNKYGLKIITLNTDFWYRSNYLNYINTTNPDNSGMQAFLISELQAAEDAGQRVWVLGHVLPGWDGSNGLPNPTNLFYQIIDRYSPHVIANTFFGHTHEDEQMIYYANNGTVQSANTALTPGWIGPSVTPLTNLNSGYRIYEVDTGSFDIYDAYTFYADVNSFPDLDPHSGVSPTEGPTYRFEYSTRNAYGPQAKWPATAPLNATFWHQVTEAMLANHTLVSQFNTYEGKTSVQSPNCTNTACAEAKVCYIRSGSVPLGKGCPQGFGSVQSKFTGKNF
ncbi:hypothetical protein MMC25_007933 [Agyrium rufum]|nr:hypothetical protein [Agyrium rufum]